MQVKRDSDENEENEAMRRDKKKIWRKGLSKMNKISTKSCVLADG